MTAQSELNIIKLAVELVRLPVCASIEFNRFSLFQPNTTPHSEGMESVWSKPCLTPTSWGEFYMRKYLMIQWKQNYHTTLHWKISLFPGRTEGEYLIHNVAQCKVLFFHFNFVLLNWLPVPVTFMSLKSFPTRKLAKLSIQIHLNVVHVLFCGQFGFSKRKIEFRFLLSFFHLFYFNPITGLVAPLQ